MKIDQGTIQAIADYHKEQAKPQSAAWTHFCELAAKSEIHVNVEKVPYTYTNGEGERVSKISLTMNLPKEVLLQGHVHVEEDFTEAAIAALITNMSLEFDAQLDEMTPEEFAELEEISNSEVPEFNPVETQDI